MPGEFILAFPTHLRIPNHLNHKFLSSSNRFAISKVAQQLLESFLISLLFRLIQFL